jgi:hypothetical protein
MVRVFRLRIIGITRRVTGSVAWAIVVRTDGINVLGAPAFPQMAFMTATNDMQPRGNMAESDHSAK